MVALKKTKKKLYTLYNVNGSYDDVKSNPDHHLVSYSSGKAKCIKYHNTLTEWLNEIISNDFKVGFGIKVLSEDGEHKVEVHNYNLECNIWTCNNKTKDYIGKIMGDVICMYFNTDRYYEIKDDYTCMCEELTGHQYYRSPYESCDSCGNCDGARCDYCKSRYIVKDLITDTIYYNGYDKNKAEKILNENRENYSDIIADVLFRYKVDMDWFEKEIGGANDFKSLFKIINKYKIPYVTINK